MNMLTKIILIAVALPFLVGLCFRMNGYDWILPGLIYVAVLVLGFGGYAIFRFTKKTGVKGLFAGIFILLVLIPLSFFGTCALSAGGNFIRGLFIK